MIIHRNSEDMHEIADGEAELICTSPPYWGPESEDDLLQPRKNQQNYTKVGEELQAYAKSLKPIYEEMRRILHPQGAVIFQIKDLRYGSFSIPLSDWHSKLLHELGLRLLGKIHWIPKVLNPERRPGFLRKPKRSNWRPLDPELFLVFSTKEGLQEPRIHENWQEQIEAEAPLEEWVQPLWKTARGRWKNNHPHAAPNPPVKRLVLLLSEPGDLVVDPFAGGGNMLQQAQLLGRRIMGYEIEKHWALTASKFLGVSMKKEVPDPKEVLEQDGRFSGGETDLIEETH